MGLLERFGVALRRARKSRGLTQEDFYEVSSRTYLSSLERGMKSPTISKVEALASVIGVHPLSILALAYLQSSPDGLAAMCDRIRADIESFPETSEASATD